MNNTDLTILIRRVAKEVDSSTPATMSKIIQPLIDAGITSNMHVGTPPEDFTKQMTLEWYAGSIIDIVEKESWFAVNSWLNCLDKFVPSVLLEG